MGKIITVIGIDGSGKSTLIDKLGYQSFHFYNGVKKSKKTESTTSKRKFSKERFFLGTILKIYIPNLISYIKHKFTGKSTLVFDRYTFDYLILLKKKKSFYNNILYFLFYFFPLPDKVVFLEVEPEVAFERKQEFDIKYLSERQESLKKAISHVPNNKLKVFNSSKSIASAYDFLK